MTPPKILYSFIEGQHKFESDGIDIVNREMLDDAVYPCRIDNRLDHYRLRKTSARLKHGDTFDLPNGLELREEFETKYIWAQNWIPCSKQYWDTSDDEKRKVFRIVKTEVKPEPESQEDLLYAIRTMESMGAPDEVILKRFTIQRKKP